MNPFDADLLRDWSQLSPPALGFGAAAGLLLWLFGWRWHRFWVVLAITVLGGLAGLRTGQMVGGHMLAFGLLLAVTAGLLALELAKLLSFLCGGAACAVAADYFQPNGQERWLAFLVGGLATVLLYRFGTMAISSFAGALLALYCGIGYELKGQADPAAWLDRYRVWPQGALAALAVLGIAVQAAVERRSRRAEAARLERAEQKIREAERRRVIEGLPLAHAPEPKGIMDRLKGRTGD